MAALGDVKFRGGLPAVVRDRAATEAQGFELDDGGEREGVQLAEPAAFVKKLGHWRGWS